MYYFKFKSETTLIEFINSFSGKETVIANGKVVSEKSSVMGTDHHFSVVENHVTVRYTLRTKILGPTMVAIDVMREGIEILKNEPVPYGKRGQQSDSVKEGLKLLRTFDLEHALEKFEEGLNTDPDDPDVHYYKACAHSLLEQGDKAFYHLVQAIEHDMLDRKRILTEDALAFIRIQDKFADFSSKWGLNS